MSAENEARPHFERFGLLDVPRVSDPDLYLYRASGLEKLSIFDFFRPSALWHVFQTAILRKHGLGKFAKGEFQLPGAFLISNNQILKSYFYQQPWEHPDFEEMAKV